MIFINAITATFLLLGEYGDNGRLRQAEDGVLVPRAAGRRSVSRHHRRAVPGRGRARRARRGQRARPQRAEDSHRDAGRHPRRGPAVSGAGAG